ncbi:phosphoadenosine phosphosulfate reductase, partial [Obelidium mucronatum]
SPEYIAYLNKSLSTRTPQEILEWALISLPGLVQTTAFGLTGLAILDMISKIREKRGLDQHPVPLIFIDTLYHFKETLDLAQKASETYNAPLQIYTPNTFPSTSAFEDHHGQKLWETDPDVYDYLVKVEPGRRAALENNAQVTITGRRRSQGAARAAIPILELDSSVSPPMLKLNVLADWDYNKVWGYIQENKVPYNELHEKGYKSIGDWHSTAPTAPGESERDGRWKGQEKTECGLHKDYFKMRSSFLAAEKKRKNGQR